MSYAFSALVIKHDLMTGLYCFLYLASCHSNALFCHIITAICLNYNAILVYYIYQIKNHKQLATADNHKIIALCKIS